MWPIIKLTFRSAVRLKVAQAIGAALFLSVICLPAMIRHNGSAEMFSQVFLTYTLRVTVSLLGMSTLWMACAGLASDIEGQQISLLLTKPLARWKLWLGKWMGILALNGVMLSLAAFLIYGLMVYQSRRLDPEQQKIFQDQALSSRGSATESMEDYQKDLTAIYQNRIDRLNEAGLEINEQDALAKSEYEARARLETVPSMHLRRWVIDVSNTDWRDSENFQIKAFFHASKMQSTSACEGLWRIGSDTSTRIVDEIKRLDPGIPHEWNAPTDCIGSDGKLVVEFHNYSDSTVLFPLENGLEILYPDGSLLTNLFRGQLTLWVWIGALAAIGMAGSSFLSFPVATFMALALLLITWSGGVARDVVAEGTVSAVDEHTGEASFKLLDPIAVPIFQGIAFVLDTAQEVSPIEALSRGRSVTWNDCGSAILKLGLGIGGPFIVIGIIQFSRRELAINFGSGA